MSGSPGPPHPTFAEVFARVERGDVTAQDISAAFGAILDGAWTPIQIGAFAASLRLRGETAEAIVAAAEALRSVMTPVDHGLDEVIDTCGTGGDGAHTLNVSTGAAIVVAACGVHVAKHGNRSVSSKCGSADVIDALGIPTDLDPKHQAAVLREAHIAFLMAPAHHPALRHAATARRELGVRTIFNALGPLVNPARVTYQLVGVYDDALRPIVAVALGKLGVRRAWVVRSEDGLDEISPAAPTRVSVLEDGQHVSERRVSPEEFGITRASSLDALAGGDARENAAAITRILEGSRHGAIDAIVLNAAAALVIARGPALLPKHAAEEAREAIVSGRARATLEKWRSVAQAARTAQHGRDEHEAMTKNANAKNAGSSFSSARARAECEGVVTSGREPKDAPVPNALEPILRAKREEILALSRSPATSRGPHPRGALVVDRLARSGNGKDEAARRLPLRLVTEIKRRSPSAGALSVVLSVAERALAYARGGASMISVLCDERFFGGSWDHVVEVRAALDAHGLEVPILAKEFILDERQLDEAAACGADAALIIVRIVEPSAGGLEAEPSRESKLAKLVTHARSLGLEPLVEVVTEEELVLAINAGAKVIGVNARDLDTLVMDPAGAARVLAAIPEDCIAIHLSGLKGPDDIASLAQTAEAHARTKSIDAALIGEALMRCDDPTPLLASMIRAAQCE